MGVNLLDVLCWFGVIVVEEVDMDVIYVDVMVVFD